MIFGLMRKRRWIILVSFAAALIMGPTLTLAQSPVGQWTTIDDATGKPRALVRIEEDHGVLKGVIEKLYLEPNDEPNPTCGACEDARKDQPVVGMTFLTGLRKEEGQLVWSGGEILDPSNGKIYRSKATLIEDGKKLLVRGYLGISLFGRTQTWLRAP